jgi:hypothetical protein
MACGDGDCVRSVIARYELSALLETGLMYIFIKRSSFYRWFLCWEWYKDKNAAYAAKKPKNEMLV